MLLALYTASPGAKDFQALKILGVGLSGLKKIRKRLFDKKLLKRVASGHRVLLPGDGHFVSQTPAVQKVNKVPRTAAAVADEIAELFDSYEKSKNDHSTGGMRTRTLAFWSWQLTELLVEAKKVFPSAPEFTDLLAKVERQRNLWTVCCYIGEFAEGEREFIRVARRLRAATDQQLALLHEKISTNTQLGPGGKAPLQLEAVLADE